MTTDEQPPTDDEIRCLSANGCTADELLLMVSRNITLNEAREEIAERRRVNARADELLNKPIDEWPEFSVNWDLEPNSFYWALDGSQPSALDGRKLVVRWCALPALDNALTHQSSRSPDELWTLGDARKVARVLVHCSEGRSLTPPWILPIAGKIGIVGGHHRLAMCRAKRLERIPVLVEESELEQSSSILTLEDQ